MAAVPIGPIITAGASLLGQGINASSTGAMNRKTRRWQEAQYDKQRRDSLADWNMMNQYNSPQAQMERLKAAGLNPNLVYGKGADNTAPMPRSSETGSWKPEAPQFDLGSAMSSFYDIEFKQAQTNNLKQQNHVLTQEAALKAAQTANTLTQNERSKFDLGLASELRQNSVQAAVENLRKMVAERERTQTETGIALQRNEREAAINASSLREAAARILSIREQTANTREERNRIRQATENLRKDSTLKQLDIDLKKLGVQPNDNMFMRILSRILNNVMSGDNPKGSSNYTDPDEKRRDNIQRSKEFPGVFKN